MDINVKTVTGNILSFSGLCEKMAVLELRKLIQERHGRPSRYYRLIYDSR